MLASIPYGERTAARAGPGVDGCRKAKKRLPPFRFIGYKYCIVPDVSPPGVCDVGHYNHLPYLRSPVMGSNPHLLSNPCDVPDAEMDRIAMDLRWTTATMKQQNHIQYHPKTVRYYDCRLLFSRKRPSLCQYFASCVYIIIGFRIPLMYS